MSVEIVDHGWERIKRDIKRINNSGVKVGLQDDGKMNEGVSLVEVGATNEFGSDDGHTPERSFMRSTFDNKVENYRRLATKLWGDILENRRSPFTALTLLGIKAADDIKRTVTTLKTPPNAQSTIDQKGSSNPLVDKGQMRAAIRHEIEGLF